MNVSVRAALQAREERAGRAEADRARLEAAVDAERAAANAARAAQVEAMSGSRSVVASRHAAMGDSDGGSGRSSPPVGEGARRRAPGPSALGVAADGVRVDGVEDDEDADAL